MQSQKLSDVSVIQEWPSKENPTRFGTLRSLENVRLGLQSSFQYRSRINTCLAASHELSDVTIGKKYQISNAFVTNADLEAVDSQYLLCGFSDGGVGIYDTADVKEEQTYSSSGFARGRSGGHKRAIECVQWYPADTGLFATSSGEKSVKLWNPNRMKTVDQFKLDCNVHHHHMSPVAKKHSLLAASGETGEIILCDLRTGSSTHRIVAHQGPTKLTKWSPRNQHILVSGGKDNAVKMWDVRSAKGCLIALDMDETPADGKRTKNRKKKNPVAHKSQVTSICFSSDGLWLLTFSYDGDLKLWNSATGDNMCVNYGETCTELKRGLVMAVSCLTYPELVFVPSKNKIVVYEMFTGRLVNVLDRHFATVLGVLYNPSSMNLYSFGTDNYFLTWTPQRLLLEDLSDLEESEARGGVNSVAPVVNSAPPSRPQITQDTWSSDED